MSRFRIRGGKPLSGSVTPIGNKNAVLKMIAGALLTDEEVRLTNVPAITDVEVMLDIIQALGGRVSYDKTNGIVTIQCDNITQTTVPADLAKQLRSSNVLLGPLLARKGVVRSVFPGGDKIGPREMTAHFDGLTALGATFTQIDGDTFSLSGSLRGAPVHLYEPSVTATENVIMASVLAPGETCITNAASEPQVKELCLMLNAMGAQISGIGTNELRVTGVASLSGTTFAVPIDYIYVATFIIIAASTGGTLDIGPVNHDDLRTMLYFFEKVGILSRLKHHRLVPQLPKIHRRHR